MPQMGESIAEGTLSRWLKKVGDSVKRDEPIFEISTDKVDAEIPAPSAGVLVEILRARRADGARADGRRAPGNRCTAERQRSKAEARRRRAATRSCGCKRRQHRGDPPRRAAHPPAPARGSRRRRLDLRL